MTDSHDFDVIVIGAGAVGENVADRVVQAGLSAALIESELVGGECSYWACMPSKALLRPGTALKAASSVAGAREAVTGTLDAQQVLDRRTEFTSNWDDSSQADWVRDSGITLVRGTARLTGERSVEVRDNNDDATDLTARVAVVLATGSTPTTPPIDGLDDVEFWGTREATSATQVPESLAVLGGGVAGAELAQAFARLGTKVTIIARSGLLSNYPQPAGALVRKGLEGDGVVVLTDTATESVRQPAGGSFTIALGGGKTVTAEKLLVSTGRRPALANLGLEDLDLDPGNLVTDQSGRVEGADWLYAVGDAAGKVLLTHQGKYEARVTGSAIAARAAGTLGDTVEDWSPYAASADRYAVPQVVFTDPEIAMAGRTVEQAREAGLTVSETSLEIAVAGSALHTDGYQGWAQMVVDEDRRVLVGVTFAGPDVAELLHAATIAIAGEVPLDRLWHAVPAYPTISEVWLRLLEKYGL
ncbi:NAD(P)/FAD-dependent oxidoreductase [Arthrobacter sp. CAN_C5]|uniref:dihydrolipoyl dehydrogenase family protein n=1 Tax=Arthrobacter sp. CAN_C5 TaxID=2760706 RepID=UPI001AE2CB0C|nr:NAD(P)/FAD-dependent oxidoreductase [Arthrobacter sp. CAN_C5]MBP2218241.1 dihydrolipoamide dehydrogenase [Arthrobacter sp. CAN_C5]